MKHGSKIPNKSTFEKDVYKKQLKNITNLPPTYETQSDATSSFRGSMDYSDIDNHNETEVITNVRKKSLKLKLNDWIKNNTLELIFTVVGVIILSFLIPNVLKVNVLEERVSNIKEQISFINIDYSDLAKEFDQLQLRVQGLDQDNYKQYNELKQQLELQILKIEMQMENLQNNLNKLEKKLE